MVTLAGKADVCGHRDGALAQSLLHGPAGLCVLPDGRLLVSDALNSCLRVVCFDTRTLCTVAGSCSSAARWQ